MVQRRRPGGARPGRRRPAGARSARSAARPAATRRAGSGGAGGTGAAKRTKAPRPRRITGRAAILLALLFGLLMAYAYPLRVYLSQQAEIALLERRQAAQSEYIAGLTVQRANWDDPEFIKAQARKRFQLVDPGAKTFIIIFDEPDAASAAAAEREASTSAGDATWYGQLWSSIAAANQPPEPANQPPEPANQPPEPANQAP